MTDSWQAPHHQSTFSKSTMIHLCDGRVAVQEETPSHAPTSPRAKLLPRSFRLKDHAAAAVLAGMLSAIPHVATAQSGQSTAEAPPFAAGMINHMQAMRRFADRVHGSQPTPPVIPRFLATPDPTGALATFQPNGATITANNAFFQNLGTNGRTCFSCHQP